MKLLPLLALAPFFAQAQIVRPVCIPYVPITSTSEYIWSTPKFGINLTGQYYRYTCWSTVPGKLSHTYTYVGIPSELSKIGSRVATVAKAKSPLASLQTLPDRITMLDWSDPVLKPVIAELPK